LEERVVKEKYEEKETVKGRWGGAKEEKERGEGRRKRRGGSV
jgi:hypothetical protein